MAIHVGFERHPDLPIYPDWGPQRGPVRFLGLEVRPTSDSRRRWVRSVKTGVDPGRTVIGVLFGKIQASTLFAETRREVNATIQSIIESNRTGVLAGI